MSDYIIKRAKELAPDGEPWPRYAGFAMKESMMLYGTYFPERDPAEVVAEQRKQERIERLEQTFNIEP